MRILKKNHILKILLTQLDLVTKKIVELGTTNNSNDQGTSPCKHVKIKMGEGG